MKRRIVTYIILGSLCLTSCKMNSEKDKVDKLLSQYETVTLEIPVEATSQQKEVTYTWNELAFKTSHVDLRSSMDDILYIIPQGQGGKNGVIYVNEEKQHTNNSTLKLAFNNKKFINNYWNNSDVLKELSELGKKQFSDVITDEEAILAVINCYYELLGESDTTANLNNTLSRLEAMSLIFKADTPVGELDNTNLGIFANSELGLFAKGLDNVAYISTKDNSLNETTANEVISRAEFIYMLMNRYYAEELASISDSDIKEYSKSFSDLNSAGEVSKNFIYYDKEVKSDIVPDKLNLHTLSYCISNADKGLDKELFKAYILAEKKGIIESSEDTNWDLAVTKGYAIKTLCQTLESLPGKINCDRGESKGTDLSSSETSEEEFTQAGLSEITQSTSIEEHDGEMWITEDLLSYLSTIEFFEGCDAYTIADYLSHPFNYAHQIEGTVKEDFDDPAFVENFWKFELKDNAWYLNYDLKELTDQGYYCNPEVEARKALEKQQASSVTQKPSNNTGNTSTSSSNSTQTSGQTSLNQDDHLNPEDTEEEARIFAMPDGEEKIQAVMKMYSCQRAEAEMIIENNKGTVERDTYANFNDITVDLPDGFNMN